LTSRDILHALKSYDVGLSGFTSRPKESVLRIFIALKIHRLGRARTATFGSNGKHTNHYTTKSTSL
jgi:hypothetical protein